MSPFLSVLSLAAPRNDGFLEAVREEQGREKRWLEPGCREDRPGCRPSGGTVMTLASRQCRRGHQMKGRPEEAGASLDNSSSFQVTPNARPGDSRLRRMGLATPRFTAVHSDCRRQGCGVWVLLSPFPCALCQHHAQYQALEPPHSPSEALTAAGGQVIFLIADGYGQTSLRAEGKGVGPLLYPPHPKTLCSSWMLSE